MRNKRGFKDSTLKKKKRNLEQGWEPEWEQPGMRVNILTVHAEGDSR